MHPLSHRATSKARAWSVVGAVTLGLGLVACGGSSGDNATSPSQGVSDPGSATSDSVVVGIDEGAPPSVDMCAKVTEAAVSSILDNAALTGSEPIPGVDGSCQYFLDVGGMEAATVQITSYPSDYLVGQRDLQTDEVELTDIDGIVLGTGGVLARTDAGTILVGAGVELSAGGKPPSQEQLVAVAKEAGAK